MVSSRINRTREKQSMIRKEKAAQHKADIAGRDLGIRPDQLKDHPSPFC
jgi:hypothetical protein